MLENKGDENEDGTPLSKMSRLQLQRYLQRKILSTEKRMGTGNHHPGVTEAEIASLLELQPHLPLAYFFRYLNCTASRNFTGAMEALHRYFDYALQYKSSRMRARKHQRKRVSGERSSEGDDEEKKDDEKESGSGDSDGNTFCLQRILESTSFTFVSDRSRRLTQLYRKRFVWHNNMSIIVVLPEPCFGCITLPVRWIGLVLYPYFDVVNLKPRNSDCILWNVWQLLILQNLP